MRRLALAAILGLVPTLALAERGNADLKKYCSGDAVTFCSGVDPDSTEMDACFTKNRKDLSENCRRAIDVYQATGGK